MGNLYYSLAIQQIARGYFTSTSYYITSLKTKTKQNATKAHILLLLLYNVCMYVYIYTDYITKKYRQHVHITVLNEMPPDSPWTRQCSHFAQEGLGSVPQGPGTSGMGCPGAGRMLVT